MPQHNNAIPIIDTHCHIHDSEFYPDNREAVYSESREQGVVMLAVGTDERSSRQAVEFAQSHDGVFAVVGVHPHDAKDGWEGIAPLLEQDDAHIVGIGEIGLDYFYMHSSKEDQQRALRAQLELACRYELPVSFHVREAFDDFWPIIDEFPDVRGVLHSFTDTQANLDQALRRGLYIGINGISTFTKDAAQQQLYQELPLAHIVLETDAPFLTPKPFRGKMNIPAYVGRIAEHQAQLKMVPAEDVIRITTANARALFGISL
ncbi:MAG TPA: TatD family hydrolase [Candidatus Saccharimonas sp.]|jgi:TatD DNase family protein|nr:TatD family hydrolase [Candidatus Saccharimonas sp.]